MEQLTRTTLEPVLDRGGPNGHALAHEGQPSASSRSPGGDGL